jgi:hypothetical protein
VVDITGGRAQRVQVKTTTRQVDGTWHCTLTRSSSASAGGRYSLDDIDYFGIVNGDHVVYPLPAAVVGARRASTRVRTSSTGSRG